MTAPKCFFFFLSGAKKGKIEESDAQVVRIGRQPYCEVALDPYQDIPASGEHCHVVREDDGAYAIVDRGSSYGTYVNDQRLQGVQKLNTGDVIECGRDDQGRIGPKLKFYLEADVKKCPICDGPVYKKNYRCPACKKKCCLRCIDFATKTCKICAPAELERRSRPAPVSASDVQVSADRPASVGYEVLPDDAEVSAKKPAKVVLKGKEAERARKKKEKQRAEKGKTKVIGVPGAVSESGSASPSSSAARTSVGTSSSLSGNVAASASRKGGAPAAKKDTLDDPFCPICCDFVKGAAFRCPGCQRTVCDSHRQGKACATCAGSGARQPPAPAPTTRRQTAPPPLARALQDSLMTVEEAPGLVPDLAVPSDSAARRAPPTRAKGEIPTGVEVDLQEQTPSKQAAPPRPLAPPPPLPRPGGPPLPGLGQGSTMRLARERGPAPGPAPCARCRLPLQDAQAFVCGGCARRICATHRTAALLCDECTARRGTSSFGRASPLQAAPVPRSGMGPVPAAPRPATPAPNPLELKNDSWGGNVIDRDGPPPEVARPFGFTTLELPPDEIVSPDQHPAAGPTGHPMGPTIREIEAMDMMPLLETEREEDDDLAPRAGGALEGLQFECPFCDAPLPPDATACPRCRKKL